MTKTKELKAENKRLKAELDEYKRHEKMIKIAIYALCVISLIILIFWIAMIFQQYLPGQTAHATILPQQSSCQDDTMQALVQGYMKTCQNQTIIINNNTANITRY